MDILAIDSTYAEWWMGLVIGMILSHTPRVERRVDKRATASLSHIKGIGTRASNHLITRRCIYRSLARVRLKSFLSRMHTYTYLAKQRATLNNFLILAQEFEPLKINKWPIPRI